MIINGPWEVDEHRRRPELRWLRQPRCRPGPRPAPPSAGAPVGGHNYVIYSGMDESKAEAAIAFVKFMSSAESQAFVADKLGLLPTRQSAYDLPEVKDNAARRGVQAGARRGPRRVRGSPRAASSSRRSTAWPPRCMIQGTDPKKSLDAVAKTYKTEVVKDYSLD